MQRYEDEEIREDFGLKIVRKTIGRNDIRGDESKTIEGISTILSGEYSRSWRCDVSVQRHRRRTLSSPSSGHLSTRVSIRSRSRFVAW